MGSAAQTSTWRGGMKQVAPCCETVGIRTAMATDTTAAVASPRRDCSADSYKAIACERCMHLFSTRERDAEREGGRERRERRGSTRGLSRLAREQQRQQQRQHCGCCIILTLVVISGLCCRVSRFAAAAALLYTAPSIH